MLWETPPSRIHYKVFRKIFLCMTLSGLGFGPAQSPIFMSHIRKQPIEHAIDS